MTAVRGSVSTISLLLAGFLPPVPSNADPFRPENLVSMRNLDGVVAEKYAGLTNWAFIYPPRTTIGTNVCFSQISLGCGWYTFSPEGDIAGATNRFQPTLYFGVPVWRFEAVETSDVSRAWLYLAPDGTAFGTNGVPASFDPRQWVRDVYRPGPPSCLSGAGTDAWYADRDRSRFGFVFTLVASNDWPLLRAAIASSATNDPPAGYPPLVLPEDTNRLSFAAVRSVSNELSLSVYTPVGGLPVDLLTRPALEPATNPWLIRSTFTPSAPFDAWSGSYLGGAAFFMAARADIDGDGDGIADCRETYVLGTDPHKWDSAGLAIGDFARMYVYGLAPLSRDTNGDGMDDDEAILRGMNPVTQNAGAGASAIRYLYDEDDRLTGTFTTTSGGTGGGAALYTVSPAHNTMSASERSAP